MKVKIIVLSLIIVGLAFGGVYLWAITAPDVTENSAAEPIFIASESDFDSFKLETDLEVQNIDVDSDVSAILGTQVSTTGKASGTTDEDLNSVDSVMNDTNPEDFSDSFSDLGL